MAAPVMLKRSATEAFSEPEIMRQSELPGGAINLSELNTGTLNMSLDALDAHIQRSPIKMLNTVARSRPLKKMRRDNGDYLSGDAATDQSDVASSPEPHPELVVDLPVVNGHTSKIRAEVEDVMPKTNGHRSFPCVWLDGSDPMRNQEGGDVSPQSQTPLDYADSPPMSTPMTTPPPAPVSAAINGLTSIVTGTVSSAPVNTPPGVNGHVTEPMAAAATPKGMPRNLTPTGAHFGGALGVTPMKGHPALSLVAEVGTDVPSSDSEVSEAVVEAVPSEVCPECRKVFKRRVYLQRHMEREHWSTAKVFKCDDCSYETKHQSNLSVHRRTHTGERPYHCGACGQRYTQGHLLKSHIRSRHAGNMQFYNLEKKSDSTRGRKSLDPKHDHLSPLVGGLGGHKQDKISALLAAASNGGHLPPQQSQTHPMRFGRLGLSPATINQYMNAIAPFPVRHMMSPQVALAGGLLMTPQLFALGGIPGGLPAIGSAMLPGTLRQGMPMMSTATTATMAQPTGIATTAGVGNSGIKIPLKIPEIPNPSGSASFFPMDSASLFSTGGASIFPTGGSSDSYSPKIRELSSDDEIAVPEDLSTKKAATVEKKVAMSTDEKNARPLEGAPQDLSNYGKFDEMSASPGGEQAAIKRDAIYEPFHSDVATMTENGCTDATTRCPHRRELRQLRRNILRMLSVFTPELNIENGIDCNSNQVDQLLHEVIYSNDDDDVVADGNGNAGAPGGKG